MERLSSLAIQNGPIPVESVRLLQGLTKQNELFVGYWQSHEVDHFYDGVKPLPSPDTGGLTLNYSSVGAAGSSELCLVVYTPQQQSDKEKSLQLFAGLV